METLDLKTSAVSKSDTMTIGAITDVHYADREMAINRYYRDSLLKIRQAVKTFNECKLPFCVQLGDIVDKGKTLELELTYLKKIEAEYAKFEGDRFSYKHFIKKHS